MATLCRLTLASVLLTLAACAATPRRGPLPGTAEALYVQGVEDGANGLYQEAGKTFDGLKTRFPYSRYAALAELRHADLHLQHDHHHEAIEGYRSFLQYHPTHIDVPLAALHIGEAYQAQIGRDWWFLPPTAEKDQANIRQAIAAYDDMLARYNDGGRLAELAQTHRNECRRRLAEHELYTARFYFKQAHYRAAAQRAEMLLHDFGDLGIDAEALLLMGHARLHLGETAQARAPLERLRADFPDSQEGQEAVRLLPRLPAPAHP